MNQRKIATFVNSSDKEVNDALKGRRIVSFQVEEINLCKNYYVLYEGKTIDKNK